MPSARPERMIQIDDERIDGISKRRDAYGKCVIKPDAFDADKERKKDKKTCRKNQDITKDIGHMPSAEVEAISPIPQKIAQ